MTTYLVGDADAHFLMCSSFILTRFPWHITLSLRHNKNLVYVSLSQCKRAYLGHIIPIVFQAHSIFHVWSATLGRGTRCVLGYRDQIGRLHSLRHNKNLVYVSSSQYKRAYLGHIIAIVFKAHSIFQLWSATLGRGTRCVLGH
jgi:hypothetical protein